MDSEDFIRANLECENLRLNYAGIFNLWTVKMGMKMVRCCQVELPTIKGKNHVPFSHNKPLVKVQSWAFDTRFLTKCSHRTRFAERKRLKLTQNQDQDTYLGILLFTTRFLLNFLKKSSWYFSWNCEPTAIWLFCVLLSRMKQTFVLEFLPV